MLGSLKQDSLEEMLLGQLTIQLNSDTYQVKLIESKDNYMRLTVKDMFVIGEKSMVANYGDTGELIPITQSGISDISIYTDSIDCIDIIEHKGDTVTSRVRVDRSDYIELLLWLRRGIDTREGVLDVH